MDESRDRWMNEKGKEVSFLSFSFPHHSIRRLTPVYMALQLVRLCQDVLLPPCYHDRLPQTQELSYIRRSYNRKLNIVHKELNWAYLKYGAMWGAIAMLVVVWLFIKFLDLLGYWNPPRIVCYHVPVPEW